MSSLSFIEKSNFENLFGMRSGYVLDFTNRTFEELFLDVVKIDIWGDKYNYNSASKANRLRAFWNIEPDNLVGVLLDKMLEYWKSKNSPCDSSEQKKYNECLKIVDKLLGRKSEVIEPITEDQFLNKEFKNISLQKLNFDGVITLALNQRLDEIKCCLNAKASLSVIFLCGSTLEGILLGAAIKNPKEFNQANNSPKDKNGKVLQFHDWTLANFIEIAHSIGLIGEDVKKFSHALRDFRNYIHPYQQIASNFSPDLHTAKICWQVLQAAIDQLSKK